MANKFNISQLLSNTSKEVSGDKKEVVRNRPFKVVSISIHDLVPSKDNFYSMEQIEELKTAIELVGGIKQNLNVVKLEGGKYKILAGHRRHLASMELVEEGKKEYEFLPCSVEEVEENLELQEIREELLLILTNSQRDKTDWDRLEESKRLKTILERYKKTGKLQGRIRDIIAETLNTSPTQIGRMDAISNNLSEEFKEELKEEKINMSTAYELSGLDEENQIEVFEEYKEKGSLTIKDVKEKKEELGKLNNEVEEKLKVEYEDLSDKYNNLSGKEVEGEIEGLDIVEMQSVDTWVPVSERLPNELECNKFDKMHPNFRKFLCTVKIANYPPRTRILSLSDTLNWTDGRSNYNMYVTAWQLIPEPYIGG